MLSVQLKNTQLVWIVEEKYGLGKKADRVIVKIHSNVSLAG